jgi:hypothetical protein
LWQLIGDENMWKKYRIFWGFLLGPLTPGILGAIYAIINPGPYSNNVAGLNIFLSALIGYPIALVLGIPIFFMMQRYGWVKLYHYFLTGFFLGIGSVALFCFYGRQNYTWPLDWFYTGSFMGIIATTSFWLIVRPDLLKTDVKLP